MKITFEKGKLWTDDKLFRIETKGQEPFSMYKLLLLINQLAINEYGRNKEKGYVKRGLPFFFEEAIELTDIWKIERKTILTWDKQIMGVGKYLRGQTEFCLLCFKGNPSFVNTKWTTLISEKRTTHSTKPEIFYKMVDEICAGRKLNYFARKKREGWDSYGDEVK